MFEFPVELFAFYFGYNKIKRILYSSINIYIYTYLYVFLIALLPRRERERGVKKWKYSNVDRNLHTLFAPFVCKSLRKTLPM